jgi:hypothetical protein
MRCRLWPRTLNKSVVRRCAPVLEGVLAHRHYRGTQIAMARPHVRTPGGSDRTRSNMSALHCHLVDPAYASRTPGRYPSDAVILPLLFPSPSSAFCSPSLGPLDVHQQRKRRYRSRAGLHTREVAGTRVTITVLEPARAASAAMRTHSHLIMITRRVSYMKDVVLTDYELETLFLIVKN